MTSIYCERLVLFENSPRHRVVPNLLAKHQL
jgi:hypothetical protein